MQVREGRAAQIPVAGFSSVPGAQLTPVTLQKPDAVELPLMVPLYPALHVQSLAASDPDMLLLRLGHAVHDTDVLLLLPALNVFAGQLEHAYTYW
jgi:hypothetical protein